MRKIAIIIMAAASLTVQAQKVTFTSPGIEAGVRQHLGIDENTDILQSQTDAITDIDLSGLGITSLSDIVYLPNVQSLNLADNDITDIGPLNVLESLRELDLKNNNLESVNLLAFSNSTKMMVDVTSNYINDFTFLFDCFKCQLTLVGMNSQKVKDAPYLDVYQLYANIGEDGNPTVCYRGYSNMDTDVHLECGSTQASVTLDGNTYDAEIPGNPIQTMQVCLTSDGEDGESTWVIPPMTYVVYNGETETIATGLPSTYRISSLSAQHGAVSTSGDDGLDIVYMAPAEAVEDVIELSYYEGSKLKGFAQLNITDVLNGDANGDKKVSIADVTAVINRINGQQTGTFIEKSANVNKDDKISIADVTGVINIINK